MIDVTCYVILDRTVAHGRDLESVLEAVLAGGSRMVQLREKQWPSGRIFPLAQRLREGCRRAGAIFIVNDRVDLALAVGADGVHLGQDDLPPAAARALLRPGMIPSPTCRYPCAHLLGIAQRSRNCLSTGVLRLAC